MNKRPQLQKKAKPPQPQTKFPLLIVTYQNTQEPIHQIGSIYPDRTWSQIKSLINIVFGFNQMDSLEYIYELQQDMIFIENNRDYQQFCQSMRGNKSALLTVLNEKKQNQSKQKENSQKLEMKIKEIKFDLSQENGLKQQNYDFQYVCQMALKNTKPFQKKIQENFQISGIMNHPQLKVHYLNQSKIIPQYGYINSNNFKSLRAIILQKLKIDTQHELIPYLKYKYWSSISLDFQEIINQKDFKIFQETVRNQKQAQIQLYQDYSGMSEQQQDLIQKYQKVEKIKKQEKQEKPEEQEEMMNNQMKQQKIFEKFQKDQESIPVINDDYDDSKSQISILSRNSQKYQNCSQNSFSQLNDSTGISHEDRSSDFDIQDQEQINYKKQKKEKYEDFKKNKQKDMYWVGCQLCKIKEKNDPNYQEQRRIDKFICIHCEKDEQVYCQTCIKQAYKVCSKNLQKKNKQDLKSQNHLLMQIPRGKEQKLSNLRTLRENKKNVLQEQQKRQDHFTYKIPQESYDSKDKIQQSTSIFLNQSWKKLFSQTNYLQQKGYNNKKQNLLQNFVNITKTDMQDIIKKICTLNCILNTTREYTGKQDMQEFIRQISSQQALKDFKQKNQNEYQYKSMLYIYTKCIQIYKTINLALKEKSIFQDPTRLSLFRYPIQQLWKEIHQKYNQKQFVPYKQHLYRGCSISEEQIKKLKQNDIISVLNFFSTSKQKQVAIKFILNALIIIEMPKFKAKFSDKCPGYYQLKNLQSAQSAYSRQKEVLFNIFSKFRVKSISKDVLQNYVITLEYLQLPELITNQNIEQIEKQYKIPKNSSFISKIQHLELISRQKIDQGKCLNILNKINSAKIFYYQRQNLIKLRLQTLFQKKRKQQQNSIFQEKYIQKIDVLKLQLAKVYMELGDVFRKQKSRESKQIYKTYSQMSEIYFNSCKAQNLSNQERYEKAKIQFNFYSRYFKQFSAVNLQFLQKKVNKSSNPKSRKIGIQSVQRIASLPGKMNSIHDYGCEGVDLMSNIIKQLRNQNQEDKQTRKKTDFEKFILSVADYGVDFAKKQLIQLRKNQRQQHLFTSKNYDISNSCIKWIQPFTNFIKTRAQYQVDQIFTIQDFQKSYKILLNCREVFQTKKEEYFVYISEINLILAIYYFQQRKYDLSQLQLKKNQMLITSNFSEQNFLWANHKDVQAYLEFMTEVKKPEQQRNNFRNYKNLCQTSLELKKQLWGKAHISLFIPLNNLAIYYFMIGDYQKFLELLKDAQILLQKNKEGFSQYRQLLFYNMAIAHKNIQNDQLNQSNYLQNMKKGEKYFQQYQNIKYQSFETKNTGFKQHQGMQFIHQKIKNQYKNEQLVVNGTELFFDIMKTFCSKETMKNFQLYSFKKKKKK